jgi:hypothetical protein
VFVVSRRRAAGLKKCWAATMSPQELKEKEKRRKATSPRLALSLSCELPFMSAHAKQTARRNCPSQLPFTKPRSTRSIVGLRLRVDIHRDQDRTNGLGCVTREHAMSLGLSHLSPLAAVRLSVGGGGNLVRRENICASLTKQISNESVGELKGCRARYRDLATEIQIRSNKRRTRRQHPRESQQRNATYITFRTDDLEPSRDGQMRLLDSRVLHQLGRDESFPAR